MQKKILIGPSLFCAIDQAPLQKLQQTGFEIIENPFKRKLTKKELLALLKQTDIAGIIAGLEPLDREVLEASCLKVISRCGSGVENVDLAVAQRLGIQVFSTSDAPTNAVAELTVGALIGLIRMIPLMNQDLHAGRWSKQIGVGLEGKTIAIIGFGRIGKRVAELLQSFKVQFLIVDPFLKTEAAFGKTVSLESAISQADIITLHSSGSRCILGEREFSAVKKGVYILNAARGLLLDESALIKALDDGRVSGVWIDAFHEEPYTGPLLKYSQVILTPHVGSYTKECRSAMETEAVRNLIHGFENVAALS